MADKKGVKKTTAKQFERMLQEMENNPDMAKGICKFGSTKADSDQFWETVKENLNSIGPPIRTTKEWRKVWADWKRNTKQKLAYNQNEKKATGGGKNSEIHLTPMEESVSDLLNLTTSARPRGKAFGSQSVERETNVPPTPSPVLEIERTPARRAHKKRSTSANIDARLELLEKQTKTQGEMCENATRFCNGNGTWSSYSNYDQCRHIASDSSAIQEELPTIIYCTGYFLSLIGLTLALIVFIYFKDLKCLRNTIHANLFLTYILSASLWILTLFLQMADSPSSVGCGILVLLYHYFQLTNFCWMLVEGLYLYTLVVQTFSSDNIKFAVYAFIGWGCPAIFVVIWSIAKTYTPAMKSEYFTGLQIGCLWLRESDADWIHIIPTCLVLMLNLIFLVRIMWVLITKLRSANTQETRQYRKASKALLVLIPLLGITYLLVLEGPSHGLESHIFNALQAFLISTQGLSVSVFFCFLNSEVRQALRHKLEIWHDARNISTGSSTRNRSRYKLSKDYSPRSRTESLRTEECSIFIRP